MNMFRLEYLLCLLAVFAAPLALASQSAGSEGPFLVVVPPWSEGRVLAAAGAYEVSATRAPLALWVSAEGAGVAQALERAGAWAVLDGAGLEWICGARDG